MLIQELATVTRRDQNSPDTDFDTHGGQVNEISQRTGLSPSEILDFSSNISPLGPPKSVLRELRSSLADIAFHPDQRATLLRNALSLHLNLSPDNIIVGNGSSELIQLVALAFVEAGDSVLLPFPTYGEYERVCETRRVSTRFVSGLDTQGLTEGILSGISRGAKVLFLCNPNNPTGLALNRQQVMRILEEARRHQTMVVLDESFVDLADAGKVYSPVQMVEEFGNLIVLRSFTKSHALAGLRIGYAVASTRVILSIYKFKVPWSVNHLAQVGAVAALRDRSYLGRARKLIRAERQHLMKGLEELGIETFPSFVNFFLADLKRTRFNAQELKMRLLQERILIRDCNSFRGLGKHHARFSVRKRSDNNELIISINSVLAEGG